MKSTKLLVELAEYYEIHGKNADAIIRIRTRDARGLVTKVIEFPITDCLITGPEFKICAEQPDGKEMEV